MISNCGHDENGQYHGGIAGDQTGTEWQIIPWYNRPWDCVLRHPNSAVREALADMARKAANNDNIGYDQYQRYTYWQELQKVNYDPSKIKTPCETDCSEGIISNTKAVGYKLNIDSLKNIKATYTGDMVDNYKAAGFIVLTDTKYRTSPDYLLPGDILLNIQNHTATNLDKGNKVVENTNESTNNQTTSTTTNNTTCKVTLKILKKGDNNSQIKAVQRILVSLKYKGKDKSNLKIDGDYGANTEYAVKAFQKAKKLTVTGKVDANTWKALLTS